MCGNFYHLNCFGPDYEVSRCCRQCSASGSFSEPEETICPNELFIPPKLREIMKLRGLKFVHQNIQSLSDKIDQLRLLLQGLHFGIQLITLSETWLKSDKSDSELEIAGYRLFRKDRKGKHGGVAVYVRDDLVATRREDLELDSVEGIWLEISVPKSRSFLIGSFYRPDRTSNYHDKDLMAKLNSILDSVAAEGKEFLVFGDFNCCFMSPQRNNAECKQLKSLFKSMNIKQLIKNPTRITKDSKSLIDLIAVSSPQNICDSGVVSTGFSDHEMVYCVRKLNWKKAPTQIKSFRNYANYNSDDFCNDLEGVNWNSVSNPNGRSGSVEALWADFKHKFVTVADHHAPIIQKRVRGIDNCPWLNKNIKLNMRQRDYFLGKARKTNHSEDWSNYRCFRNRVTRDVKKAKADYNKRIIDESGGDHRSFWKTMKKILPGEKKSTSPSIRVNGTLSSDKRCIASAFNTFFASAATRLVDSLRSSCVPSQRQSGLFTREYPPFKFQEVYEEVVLVQLRGLKVGKAVGLGNIPARLLKDFAGIVNKPLTTIINASLRSGQVPSDWKAARVIPLFKKGKVVEMDDYRPISILPVISKVLERVVHQQLTRYLHEHKILSPYQCGFRKCHSTEFAALSFADTIRRNIDQGQLTGAVFIDLRKAFDTVNHDVLLDKLTEIGVLGHERDWFSHYLMNRTQSVEFQGVTSCPVGISVGVPQGSILGPLLFLLHVNDLPGMTSECSILMYADDTVLFCSSPQASLIANKLNNELREIERWLFDNSLFINKTKTEAMLFGTAQRLSNAYSFDIHIDGKQIKRVSEFTYLGVVFDERLSFNGHVKKLISKAGKRVGMVGRLRDNLTLHSANVVYTTLIRPILDYCDTVWGCCGEGNAQALQALQNRAARIIARTDRSSPATDILKWPSLADRRRNNVFKLVKKCIRGRCPQYFKEYFKCNGSVHQRATRQKNQLHLPAVRTETAKRSFYYYGCTVFNSFMQ